MKTYTTSCLNIKHSSQVKMVVGRTNLAFFQMFFTGICETIGQRLLQQILHTAKILYIKLNKYKHIMDHSVC